MNNVDDRDQTPAEPSEEAVKARAAQILALHPEFGQYMAEALAVTELRLGVVFDTGGDAHEHRAAKQWICGPHRAPPARRGRGGRPMTSRDEQIERDEWDQIILTFAAALLVYAAEMGVMNAELDPMLADLERSVERP